jgi:hypothetical protein
MKHGSLCFIVLSALILAIGASANADVFDGLELYYGFENDNQTAGGIHDQSGNNRNGSAVVVSDSALGYFFDADVPAAIGSGLSIRADGTDEILADTPNYDGILGSNSRTVAAWVKVDTVNSAVGNNLHIIEWGTSDGNGERWNLRRQNGAANQGSLRAEIAGDNRVGVGADMNDGAWHHVAAVFDNTSGSLLEQVTLYFDGEAFTTYADGGGQDPINTSSTVVRIGGGESTASREWNGWLDEVGIWSRPLSADEVGQLAAGATFNVPEPSSTVFIGMVAIGLISRRRKS